jgi:peptidoglycan/LPS O-acetylase OafA/YrhL
MQIKNTHPDRYIHIDALRAIAILGVMIIHSIALYLGPYWVNNIWNYLHFVVVAFVICSGYVITKAYFGKLNLNNLKSWYLKRFIRLYLPYAIFVIIYGLLSNIFPMMLQGRGLKFHPEFVFSSLIFIGDIDIGWLPLLFIQLMIITPFLFWILNKKIRTSTLLITLCLLTLVMVFRRIPQSESNIFAWIPWSAIFLLGGIYAKCDNQNKYFPKVFLILAFFSLIGCLVFNFILIQNNQPLTLTLHKYPPDLFYFSYGITLNCIILYLLYRFPPASNTLVRFISFLSTHSYSIFFIHLFFIDLIMTNIKNSSIWSTLVLTIGLTLLFVWGWTKIKLLKLFRLLFTSKKNISGINTQR